MPGLTCNLISVSQVVDETDCVAAFSKHVCVLQDRTSKMLMVQVNVKMDFPLSEQVRVMALKVTGKDSRVVACTIGSSFNQSYQVSPCSRH